MKEQCLNTERAVVLAPGECQPRGAVLAPGGRPPGIPPILGGLPVPPNPLGPLGPPGPVSQNY